MDKFERDYWRGMVDMKDAAGVVRINGEHYMVGPEGSEGMKGHGGRTFEVQMADGRTVTTDNLWYQGPIPEQFRNQLPDNAVGVQEIQVAREPARDEPAAAHEVASYEDYVDEGVFGQYAPSGELARSDSHSYVGAFGSDWTQGAPMYDIGPSGTDEEYTEERANYEIWKAARALRELEAQGHEVLPEGIESVTLPERDFIPAQLDESDPYIKAAYAQIYRPSLFGDNSAVRDMSTEAKAELAENYGRRQVSEWAWPEAAQDGAPDITSDERATMRRVADNAGLDVSEADVDRAILRAKTVDPDEQYSIETHHYVYGSGLSQTDSLAFDYKAVEALREREQRDGEAEEQARTQDGRQDHELGDQLEGNSL